MKITIAGQHVTIKPALHDYVEERLSSVVTRYFDHATGADVHFVGEGHDEVLCNIIVHEGAGHHFAIKSDASCDDIYSSFDIALGKCEKQLRKYKSKLKDRHNRVKVSEVYMDATKYIMKPTKQDDETSTPVTIAEKATKILTISVEEALMKMDLENLPAVMFKNSKTGRMNVVYYRKDGNISWVDSTSE
ncbi:MAG: ribosome-associated translation inhibitor RaiA [Rickettsiaceae bacterium]|nr:ribosome-associated translation inhibitor RaiA [Rickettsiaceae bacterium]